MISGLRYSLEGEGGFTLGYISSAPRSPDKAQQRVGIMFGGFTPTRGVIKQPKAEAYRKQVSPVEDLP